MSTNLPLPVLPLLLLMLVPLVALLPLMLAPPAAWLKGYLAAAMAGASVLTLSGCGTAPLQAAQCPPVPAALMEPPQEPVLLQPTPGLKTPGPTTPKTPRGAASTGRTIDA